MEKTKTNRKSQKNPINLKNLPPIDPSIITPIYQDKYVNQGSRNKARDNARLTFKQRTKLVEFNDEVGSRNPCRQDMAKVEEEYVCLSSTKLIDPNSICNNKIRHNNIAVVVDVDDDDDGAAIRRVSPKSELNEICAANYWKSPLYECCKEEGPSHVKLFTYKVVVEIKQGGGGGASTTILECYSDPQPKKKIAADHAAEGALWYLRHLGYFPHNKKK